MNKQGKGIIATRNRDVEHIVNAAARYGVYGFGKMLPKRFSILVTTDIHRCRDSLQRAVEYLDDMDALDIGICLGDVQGSDYSENDGTWYTDVVRNASKRFYTTIGNHDGGNSSSTKISGSKRQVFEKFIMPLRNHMHMPMLEKTYYSVNFDEYKVTLIVLDNYDVPDDLELNGDFLYSRGVEMIGQSQAEWLAETLADIPKEYHVIIARHNITEDNVPKDSNWTQSKRPIYGFDCGCVTENLVSDLVDAWMHGKTLDKEYYSKQFPMIPAIKISADYTNRGKGNFVGYMVGHTHKDWLGVCKKYPKQNIINFASTANDNWQNYSSDLPRLRGTKSEDCITVMTVDTEERCIYLVRVGSNITCQLIDRTFVSLQYSEMEEEI